MSDAKEKPKKEKAAKKPGGSFLGWLMLCLPIMLAFGLFYTPLLMILVLMAPGWLALLSDSAEERALAVCVASGTLAGAMFTVAPYLLHVPPIGTAMIMLQSAPTWIYPLAGAAAGAVLFYLTPLVVVESVYVKNQSHKKALETAQKKLAEEWGEEVKG
jgi:hypothetical protein